MSFSKPSFNICCDPAKQREAEILSEQLDANIVDCNEMKLEGFSLNLSSEDLQLKYHDSNPPLTLKADWVEGKAAWRRGQPELISKAVGSHRLDNPHLVDATAGLGRDSLVLAGLGCQVTAIERSRVVYELIKDAQQRALADDDIRVIAEKITLLHGEAVDLLANVHVKQAIDIVYLDPMYPMRQKSAQVKKDMRIFQHLLGEATNDNADLLEAARDTAIYRVVVKRPLKGESLAGVSPSFSIKGRSTRFDVYTKKKLP